MGKFRESVHDNNRRHVKYRAYYWLDQMRYMFNLCACFFIADLIGILLSPLEYPGQPQFGYIKYGIGVPFTLVFALYSKWIQNTKLISSEKKPVHAERFMLIAGILLVIWGDCGLEVAIVANHTVNILMYLIMLGIMTAFFTFPGHHYFIIIFVTCIVSTIIFLKHTDVRFDATSSVCAVIMMLIFFRLGYVRYMSGRNRFEAESKNADLMQELEAQNEELNASNQELVAINEELTDISTKLRKALEELEDSSETQKRFTNAMNHELRAPLNGILGNIQVMLMDEALSDDLREDLNQSMVLCKSLLGIVNDMLDSAKLQAGEFEILPAAFDLHTVLDNVMGIFKNDALQKGLELKLDITSDTACGLYGDDFRIQQILTNIVSNAVKYTEKGSVLVKVRHEDGVLKMAVSDTGQGISEESMEDLFKPFKRIDEFKNRKIMGTGLGMSIVDQLVRSMKGTISVDSKLGEGSTFTICIPAEITDASNVWGRDGKNAGTALDAMGNNMAEVSDVAEDLNGAGAANKADALNAKSDLTSLEGLKLLYVDDTKINLKVLKGLLRGTGTELTTTEDPFAGIELAKENKYDIILLDHQMPDISGPEVYERIKAESSLNADAAFIALTGNAGAGVAKQYKDMGFAGYLTKPVLKEDLIETLIKVGQ